MNFDERHLKMAMHEAADPLNPPVSELVAGGVARGRQLRRRHLAKVASGALAVAVAGVGAAFAVPQLAPGSDTITAEEATLEFGSQPVDGEVQAFEEIIVDTLVGLLPPGEVSDLNVHNWIRQAAEDDPEERLYTDGDIGFSLVFDDGDGPSSIYGSVTVITEVRAADCPVDGLQCTTESLKDGTELTVISGQYYRQPGREPDRLDWSVQADRPDGLRIHLGEINAPTEKGSAVTRPEPPLSLAQLTAIVTSDEWPEVVESLVTFAAERERRLDEANQQMIERAEAQSAELIADLGPGWVPATDAGMEGMGLAAPSADHAAGVPDGYDRVLVLRDLIPADSGGGQQFFDSMCSGYVENGTELDPCAELTMPDGSTVFTQWSRSIADGHPWGAHDQLYVHVMRDGDLTRVLLLAGEPDDTSTPERRAAAVAWMEDQLDDLIRAATRESIDAP